MLMRIVFISSLFIAQSITCFESQISWTQPQKEGILSFIIPATDDNALYKEHITFVTDHDEAAITHWTTDQEAITWYDPISKENKKIYTQDVPFKVYFTIKKPITDTVIRVTYFLQQDGHIQEELFKIPIALPVAQSIIEQCNACPSSAQNNLSPSFQELITKNSSEKEIPSSWSFKLSQIIKHTESLWIQCFLIFLLGALLSLTPCIYPMIPITVGILQGQGSRSIVRNFFISCCYTIGVATTFALFGAIAAYTGKLFGTFMHHPLVIATIVIMLLYLAGSMFGFYEMYIPQMFNASPGVSKGGSPLTAFLFGAVSGTVASPCVSPGLALVLSIVAGLANIFLGFLFLFAFGVGLSLPLLIIGTFSSSLNVLPRAGIWMVEIKKLFGFLLLGMSIYFLSIAIPPFVTSWLTTILLVIIGIYLIYISKHASIMWRFFTTILGIIFVASAIVSAYFAARATIHQEITCTSQQAWITDYHCARQKALKENKLVFIKVEAPCCSMCTAIDKKFFKNDTVMKSLEAHYIPVRIDGCDDVHTHKGTLVKQFGIVGFPTLLIVDPTTENIKQKWASELYNYTIEQFIATLNSSL